MCTICIDVKLLISAGGRWGTLQSAANEDVAMFLRKRTCLYTYIVPPLGAYKTQLGGHIFHRVVWSMSTVIIRLYIILYGYGSKLGTPIIGWLILN